MGISVLGINDSERRNSSFLCEIENARFTAAPAKPPTVVVASTGFTLVHSPLPLFKRTDLAPFLFRALCRKTPSGLNSSPSEGYANGRRLEPQVIVSALILNGTWGLGMALLMRLNARFARHTKVRSHR